MSTLPGPLPGVGTNPQPLPDQSAATAFLAARRQAGTTNTNGTSTSGTSTSGTSTSGTAGSQASTSAGAVRDDAGTLVAAGPITNTGVSGVGATTEIAQAGRGNPNPLAPDAFFYGAATGPIVPPNWRGGAFITMPSGNGPFDFTTQDGTPSNVIFVSKNVVSGTFNPAVAFSRSGVGTYNPETRQLELGYGGTIAAKAFGTPVIVFANARANPPENFTGTISGNVGIGFSVDQAAAGALGGMARAARTIPHPKGQAAAGGLQATSDILRGVGQGANGYLGAGYRVEFKFVNGQFDGMYYKGQKIVDLEKFAQDAVSTADRYKPPVIPNNGSPAIANLNYTNQLAFGTSPWDLGATSGGKNHGNGAVAAANAVYSLGQQSGVLAPGQRITSMAQAGQILDEVITQRGFPDINKMVAGDPGELAYAGTLNTLAKYDLDFGSIMAKTYFGLAPATERPGDYAFVRNTFEGDYRHWGDNPAVPPGGNSRPRL